MTKIRLIKEKVSVSRYLCTELDLHSYVDGELSSAERGLVLASVMKSDEIREQLNELEQLKELVRISYK